MEICLHSKVNIRPKMLCTNLSVAKNGLPHHGEAPATLVTVGTGPSDKLAC